MKKVISFSLWGDKPFYNVGAIRNAELALEHYPDWVCYYYVSNDVPSSTIVKLNSFEHVRVIEMNKSSENFKGTLWRFYCISDSDVDVMISRDVDGRLSEREAEAVEEWLNSGEVFHIMRDHPMHTWPIAAGMWGCRCKEVISHIRKMEKFSEIDFKNFFNEWYSYQLNLIEEDKSRTTIEELEGRTVDQLFLKLCFYEMFFQNSYVHDSFPMHNCWSGRQERNRSLSKEKINTGFPTARIDWNDFVGQIFYEDGSANEESSNYLKEEYYRMNLDYLMEDIE